MCAFRFATLISTALFCLTAANAQPGRATTPDLKEIRDYRLNMDVVQRYVKAVTALSSDPGSKKCMENNPAGNAKTLDDGEKAINSCAPAAAIIKDAGLKPREFLIITGALIGDVMAVSMKKNGMIKDYPPSISPENATFVDQNFDKLQTILAPLNMGGGRR